MRLVVIVVATAMLAACVSSKPTIAPDGKPGFAVSCNGGLHNIGDCYTKAGQLCPQGFNVIAGESGGPAFVGASGGVMYGGSIEKRTLIVECKT